MLPFYFPHVPEHPCTGHGVVQPPGIQDYGQLIDVVPADIVAIRVLDGPCGLPYIDPGRLGETALPVPGPALVGDKVTDIHAVADPDNRKAVQGQTGGLPDVVRDSVPLEHLRIPLF